MNKQILSKIKMKNRAATIGFLKGKINTIIKCMLNIEINQKMLAKKQLQTKKGLC